MLFPGPETAVWIRAGFDKTVKAGGMESLGTAQKTDAKRCGGEFSLACTVFFNGNFRLVSTETLAVALFFAGIGFRAVNHLDIGDTISGKNETVIIQHRAGIIRRRGAAGKFTFKPDAVPFNFSMRHGCGQHCGDDHQDDPEHVTVSFSGCWRRNTLLCHI